MLLPYNLVSPFLKLGRILQIDQMLKIPIPEEATSFLHVYLWPITARQRSCGKVMFSETCVVLFTGGLSLGLRGRPRPPKTLHREIKTPLSGWRPRPLCREIETPKKETEFPWREIKTSETFQRETETPLVEDQDPAPYRETEPLPWETENPLERDLLVLTSIGGNRTRQYTSYWNAFLLLL